VVVKPHQTPIFCQIPIRIGLGLGLGIIKN
jgi:hypothetical protein